MAKRNTRASTTPLPPFDAAAVVAAIPAMLAFDLFDHLPDTYLFVKDLHHRFVHGKRPQKSALLTPPHRRLRRREIDPVETRPQRHPQRQLLARLAELHRRV